MVLGDTIFTQAKQNHATFLYRSSKENTMRNSPPEYLASRLGISSNQKRNVPYGWELPEEDQMLEQPKPERAFLKLALVSVSVLVIWSVLHGFGPANIF
jgi:hypothetical protein